MVRWKAYSLPTGRSNKEIARPKAAPSSQFDTQKWAYRISCVLFVILFGEMGWMAYWASTQCSILDSRGGGSMVSRSARMHRENSSRSSSYRILEAYQKVRALSKSKDQQSDKEHADAAVVPFTPQRVFPKWTMPFPCAPWEGSIRRTATKEGFLYVKEYKTGSSTVSGVTIRIARNMARRLGYRQWEMCRARFFHTRARRFEERTREKSFLFTILRNPTDRLVSKFFHFAVSRENVTPSALAMEAFYRSYPVWIVDHNYYLKTMTLIDINPREVSMYYNFTQMLLDDYDFIGTTERLDESLVVLQLLLGLETGDILYMPFSKTAGSFEYLPKDRDCRYLLPRFITPDMEKFFQSKFWTDYTEADNIIYQAINRSLDLTIDALGRDVVRRALHQFQFAQGVAWQRCRKSTRFPCSSDGIDHHNETNCVFADSACGYECLDQVAKELPSMPLYQAILV